MDFFTSRKIIITEDGSSSIYLPAFDEHYHSVHGALQESKHVFMKMGWEPVAEKQDEISILEIGFGTGLNAMLVLEEVQKYPEKTVRYTSLEAYPVSNTDAAQLNYFGTNRELFLSLHEAEWENNFSPIENFTLLKKKIALEGYQPKENQFDLVFFDAFSPRVQPELWTADIFRKMYSSMKPGGKLVTYCSKGEVRRSMVAAGLTVEKLPGPKGKREMVRAEK